MMNPSLAKASRHPLAAMASKVRQWVRRAVTDRMAGCQRSTGGDEEGVRRQVLALVQEAACELLAACSRQQIWGALRRAMGRAADRVGQAGVARADELLMVGSLGSEVRPVVVRRGSTAFPTIRRLLGDDDLQAALLAPVRCGSRVEAVLRVAHPATAGGRQEIDAELAVLPAHRAALALEALEEARPAMLGQNATGLVHDIRNAMAGILLATQRMAARTSRVRPQAHDIHQQVERIVAVARAMLDLARDRQTLTTAGRQTVCAWAGRRTRLRSDPLT